MSRATTAIIGLLFIFSGITSLVYESLWIRVLSLGVGSTSDSISMVLSIFFFGLSLGSYGAGKLGTKIKNPLLAYGILEGAIGVYSFIVIYVLINFHHILTILPLTGALSWLGVALKFLLVFVFLIFPSLGMGATLPLLVQFFVRNEAAKGKYLSVLYGINTLGAVLGAFLAGFFIIPQFGVIWGNHLMVVFNIAIFFITLWITKTKRLPTSVLATRAATKESKGSRFNLQQKAIIFTCGITGFSSIAAEVVWNKYLGIFLGTNIFGLGLVLSLFLLGIALGSFILSIFVEKVENKERLFISLLLVATLFIMVSSYLLNMAPAVSNVLGYYFGATIPLIVIKSVVSGVILFLPTFAFGALLPLGITLLAKNSQSVSEVTGTAYAVNTIGSILGSCLAGLAFIPLFGSGITIQIAIGALLFAGILLVFVMENVGRMRVGWTALLVALIYGSFSHGAIDYKNIIKSAYFQSASSDMSLTDAMKYFSRDYEEFKAIFEGKTAIISLSHDPQDGENYQRYFRLKTNGLNESVYSLDNLTELPKYEALLGYLPYAHTRAPESVFIVGYGGGFTVDFLTSLNIKNVYVAELEKGILKAADYVHGGMNPILQRKNLNLEINDARYVLAAKLHGPYDIIVSQPSHSWLSGVANLFTKEFFEIVRGNLNEDGVFSQWLNLYNMDETVLKSILKTFYSVFPHGAVYTNYEDQELIMLGATKPLQLNFQKLKLMTQNSQLQSRLTQIPFSSPYDVLSNFLASRESILKWTGDAPENTDINAHAEIQQSLLFYAHDKYAKNPQAFLSNIYDADFASSVSQSEFGGEFYYELIQSLQRLDKFDKLFIALDKYEKTAPPSTEKSYRLGNICLRAQRYACAEKNLKEAFQKKRSTETLNALLGFYMQTSDFSSMQKILDQNPGLRDSVTTCYAGEAYFRTKQTTKLQPIISRLVASPEAYLNSCGVYLNKVLGLYYADRADFNKAKPFLESYYSSYSYDSEVYAALLAAYLGTKDYSNAANFADAFRSSLKGTRSRLEQLAEFYESKGLQSDAEALKKLAINLDEE